MKYYRKFWVQASHFNNELTYKNYFKAVEEKDFNLLHKVLEDCHGHNFKVEIESFGEIDSYGFVIDDIKLGEIVFEWNNSNLTLHKDFYPMLMNGYRVSLEFMVETLKEKILKQFPTFQKQTLKIKIHETEDIYAES
jgi:6-pyruvoyl-tetrahydropterin synthase